MNKYNLKIGMILYCKNGETVKLASFSDTHIRVIYKGKIHERPITVLNEKLFFVKSCEKVIPVNGAQTLSPTSDEPRSSPTETTSTHNPTPIDKITPTRKPIIAKGDILPENIPHNTSNVSSVAKKEETWTKSCRNCKFQVSGECSSWDLCDDYQQVYTPPKSETDYYPKYGDATMFKKKGRRK